MTRGLWSLIQVLTSFPTDEPAHCPYSMLVTLQKNNSLQSTHI